MSKPAILAIVGILAFGACLLLAIFLLTRPPAPGAALAERPGSLPPGASRGETVPPAPGLPLPGTLPGATPPEPGSGALAAPEKRTGPALPAALRGEPVVPLPSDPADRADTLEAVRQQRLAGMLERRNARQRR